MPYQSIHGVTGLSLGRPELKRSNDGKPYWVRSLIIKTADDGTTNLTLFTNLDEGFLLPGEVEQSRQTRKDGAERRMREASEELARLNGPTTTEEQGTLQ